MLPPIQIVLVFTGLLYTMNLLWAEMMVRDYNIGFLDVCNRPYSELSQAAMQSHERMYDLTNGKDKPFVEVIEYLPKLF